jgi:hypothetical protein
LNSVLNQLRDQYNFHFSYSDNHLSKYRVTLSKSFKTKDEAVDYLFKDLPFTVKKKAEVFIIIPDKIKLKEDKKKEPTQITGQIVEAGSYEPLPFSRILINNQPMIADISGNFNYTASADSPYHLRISHLGYFVCDTILYAGNFHQYQLIPSSVNIPEIVVHDRKVEKATLVGEEIAKITLNHNISRYLPSQGDNSVFHHIRLMPGIQAAGEQSTDLLIWGSYEGQSLVTFDDFTIFGLKNYNDNISVVNPFLVKTIEIYKGGYGSKFGNRVGGIVNITGKNGHLQKPVLSLNINTTTLNGMLELPLFKKSTLLMAYRQTYYNLYNPDDFNIFAPTRPQPKDGLAENQNFDINVYPDNYRFQDMNLKYSFNFDNGDQLIMSMYGGGDYFHLLANAELSRIINPGSSKPNPVPLTINILNSEKNKQLGYSAVFHKKWKANLSSRFIYSYSDFFKEVSDEVKTVNSNNQNSLKKDEAASENKAMENSLRAENTLNLIDGHRIEFGGGYYGNKASINNNLIINDTLSVITSNHFSNNRLFANFEDFFPIGNRFELKTGVRFDMTLNNPKLYFEPRISTTYRFDEQLKLSASYGKYHQYVYKMAIVDRDQNYSFVWVASDLNTTPIDANHWVGELNYSHNNWTFNLEAYYKTTHNIKKRVFERQTEGKRPIDAYYLYTGNAKSYGMDLFLKKEIGKHSIWGSYSLGKTLESLASKGKPLSDYTLAPHHQTHELKLAGLLNFGNFYFSSNYVFGSGVEILRKTFEVDGPDVTYNRLDFAITYKFTPKHFSSEIGFSILNVFDTQNLKYDNFKNIKLGQELGDIRVYSDAVPFTPIVFLKFGF